MIFRRPCYYDDFTCKAQSCSDNCCIGWEICIDDKTAEKYRLQGGDFGKRLRESISFGEEPSFILKGERCPFLNENNLCDIIINMGDSSLCQICRDHPRYFEWYGNTKEGGIGLSCEEGARLILTESCYGDYFESETDEEADEDSDEEFFSFLFSLREKIYDILGDCSFDLEERLGEIACLAENAERVLNGDEAKEKALPVAFDKQLKKALDLLEKTEPIDERWQKEFSRLKENSEALDLTADKTEEKYLERLFAYFVWRYLLKSLFDGEISKKISFAVFSVAVIFALYKNSEKQCFESLVKSAVLYSKQMEYSQENLDMFFYGE